MLGGGGGALGGKRRTFVSGRRNSFLDLESTVAALAESESKLTATLVALRALELEHSGLSAKYAVLLEQFTRMKADAVHTVWTYCPEKSSEFRFLPRLDESLGESSTNVGEYEILRVVGKGQFSTVMAGVRKGGVPSFSIRASDVETSLASLNLGAAGLATTFGAGGALVAPNNTPAHTGADTAVPGESSPEQVVYRARIGAPVAIKIVPKDMLTSIDAVRRVERELRALLELRGESSIAGVGIRHGGSQQATTHHHSLPPPLTPHPPHHPRPPPQPDSPHVVAHHEALHGSRNLYIINELLPMDLYDFLGRFKDRITPVVAAVVLRELLDGLRFLEGKRIAHRDLKPENVLVEVTRNEVVVKICDFNLCAFLPPSSSILTDFVGSPGFFAPEVLLTRSFCALKADMYGFGCIALEMLATPKFFSGVWMSAFACIQTIDAPNFSQAIKHATAEAQKELRRHGLPQLSEALLHALALQPALRASATALRANAWLAGASKFQAADVLNDRQHRKVIEVPAPSPADQAGPASGHGPGPGLAPQTQSQPLASPGGAARGKGRGSGFGVVRAGSPAAAVGFAQSAADAPAASGGGGGGSHFPSVSPLPSRTAPMHARPSSQPHTLPRPGPAPAQASGMGPGIGPGLGDNRPLANIAAATAAASLSPLPPPPALSLAPSLQCTALDIAYAPALQPSPTAAALAPAPATADLKPQPQHQQQTQQQPQKLPATILALAATNLAHLRRVGSFSNCGGGSGSSGSSLKGRAYSVAALGTGAVAVNGGGIAAPGGRSRGRATILI